MPEQKTSAETADKILADLVAFSNMGFSTGYFRIDRDIDSAALPSERLRRQYLEYETKYGRSTDSYEEIENRHNHVQGIVTELEAREQGLIEKFSKNKRKGTDAFFGTVVLTFVIAIIVSQFFVDEQDAASAALNVLSVLPIIYIPTYIFMKVRAKKLYEKAHALSDLIWVFPWGKQ